MKRLIYVGLILLFGCGVTLSPTLLQDGNLALTALTTLNSDAKLLGAPAADTMAIDAVASAVQTALADLKKGVKTPSDFAQLVNDQVSQLAPVLLKDFKANGTITTGVVLLQQLVLLIGAEANMQQTSIMAPRMTDARQNMQDWLNRHKK